jgi:hypothetical protein
MKVDNGTEAEPFHIWEYMNCIFFAVWPNASCPRAGYDKQKKERKIRQSFFLNQVKPLQGVVCCEELKMR